MTLTNDPLDYWLVSFRKEAMREAVIGRKDAGARAARADNYVRHRPEQTLLYQLAEARYPACVAHLAARGRTLPAHVQREFEDYLKCGRLEHGFLRVRCADCHAERLVAFSWPLLRIPAPAALVIPFTSQATWLLPELRCAPDGR